MLVENINLVAQLLDSMELASKELEDALKKNDVEKFQKVKAELLRFQKQMEERL